MSHPLLTYYLDALEMLHYRNLGAATAEVPLPAVDPGGSMQDDRDEIRYDPATMATKCPYGPCSRGGPDHNTERCKGRNGFDQHLPHKSRWYAAHPKPAVRDDGSGVEAPEAQGNAAG